MTEQEELIKATEIVKELLRQQGILTCEPLDPEIEKYIKGEG